MINKLYIYKLYIYILPAENEQQFEVLKNIADDLGRAAVSGNLSQSIGFNVSSLGIIPPPPSSSDPTWNEVRC